MNSNTKHVVSGITPSGVKLHMGNYFGAIMPYMQVQNEVDHAFFLVADLHALTTVQKKQQLEENIRNVVLDYLAFGFDENKVTFFRQSHVPAHSQLSVVLGNYISYGQMKRMHAFKDKLKDPSNLSSINMGLFNYPILMAADILLYNPFGVPVGEDQRQHVELTRDVALNFNNTYDTEFFNLPNPIISKNKDMAKVPGTDGEKKMSKSLGNVIGIFDDEETIRKQIMSCYTDPLRVRATDPGKVEGNPVFVFHDLLNSDKSEVEDLKSRYIEGRVGDVEVKEKLFNAHLKFFAEIRNRRKELEENPQKVNEVLEKGKERANKVANETLEEIYKLIGLK